LAWRGRAWQWSETTGTDYERPWSHLQEGLALGFSERQVLDEWLWLRYLWQNNKP
jgi:hypothetical protein